MRTIPLLAALCTTTLLHAQPVADSLAGKYAGTITREDLRRDLEFLASDALEGRDTGEKGQKMAAAYIRQHFVNAGIPPVPVQEGIADGYYQPFDLEVEQLGALALRSGTREFRFMEEILYFDQSAATDGRQVDELVYLGDGTDLTRAGDLRGRAVWAAPEGGSAMSVMMWLRQYAERLAESGVDLLLISTGELGPVKESVGRFVTGRRMRLPDPERAPTADGGMQVVLIGDEAMAVLIGSPKKMAKLRKKKPGRKVPVEFTVVKPQDPATVRTENVLGYIEGTDKKDELVIVTAHYDHEGIKNGEVYNGADDNASGTVAALAIAQAFARAKAAGHGPRRSVLVMPVSAEEKGLLGSRYYSDHPVFPLEATVANLNLDMVGRIDSAHMQSGPYLYVIGSDRLSTELHAINEAANAHVGLELDYRFNAEDDPNKFYFRSDHYNFARKGIPSIFYFSGVHPDYHTPADTADKVRFDLLHKRTLLVFRTAWELANRAERIVVDKPLPEGR
ncbi:MAG: M28 family peptidase [Flavobacteriales bacterium]|jgi:hypothetical protein|nr:M28 family peptidase [Flavobacteriales bacterium]